jgi:signal transduction histidine kinase/response regulator RpfG family c-di-GMP phosphodiesterase
MQDEIESLRAANARLSQRAADLINELQDTHESQMRLVERGEKLDLERRLDALLQSEHEESALLSQVAHALGVTHGLSARTVRIESASGLIPSHHTESPIDDPSSPLLVPVHCGGRVFAQVRIEGGPWDATWRQRWLPILESCGSRIGMAIRRMRVELENERIRAELLRARDEAVAASRAKTVFLTNISHELRTPLHTIIGYSELLIEESACLPPEQVATDLRKVLSAGVHLLHLINDVLDLSRIEDGKMQLNLKSFDVCPVIRDVVASIQPLAEDRQNEVIVHCLPSIGPIVSDEQKVRQILTNLLTNAAKFTENGTIGVFVSTTSRNNVEHLAISISDTGIGIPESMLEQLFQPFVQADTSTTRRFGGNGLGLAISRRLSQMLGGEIQVASTPGAGSVFSLLLPAIEATRPANHPSKAPTSITAPPSSGQPTILALIEPPKTRERLANTLASEGFRIVTPTEDESPLAVARTARPDLIAIDVSEPNSRSWHAVADIKADPTLSHIPVVLTVTHPDHEPDIALGATDCFIKPLEWDRFEGTIARHMRDAVRKSILVVDDDADASEIARRLLELDGWSVETASNGREALEVLQRHTPALIVVDLVMPVMDGFSLVEHLQATPELRDIPTIVVSSISLEPEEHLRLNARITSAASSPDRPSDLLTTLRRFIPQGSTAAAPGTHA